MPRVRILIRPASDPWLGQKYFLFARRCLNCVFSSRLLPFFSHGAFFCSQALGLSLLLYSRLLLPYSLFSFLSQHISCLFTS
ncbi:uncharacterized protein M421DRAFT_205301 [Didymella exigua CBS 183.55]|uniref:Uncharacterized protein n=1 Tax=Didymella exigua CBS 183.55 TaxID=1150837 RepID=A0A6A5RGU7_9PLEO|nr:uncharacterized protein M421DRAFT_205301 [Didymella exigua CBS 183.55]KAF1926713.1 hypothetical protein M421DRAFT_205301 [Didymella exigua CBS 183.55]